MTRQCKLIVTALSLFLVMLFGITFTEKAYADYELYDPYPVEISLIGGKFHYKNGEQIKILMKFSVGVTCDQYSAVPGIRMTHSDLGFDSWFTAEWVNYLDGQFSVEETQYFVYEITGNEADGEYIIYDMDPNDCYDGSDSKYTGSSPDGYMRSLLAKPVVIDNQPPMIVQGRITTDTTHKIVFEEGASIAFEISFDEPVEGNFENLSIQLNNGGVANYTSKKDDQTLNFTYKIKAGEDTERLDTVKLVGTLQDLAGNVMPEDNKAFVVNNNPGIIIDTTAPVVSVDKTSAEHYARSHQIVLTVQDRDPEPAIYHLWSESKEQPEKHLINGVGAASGEELPLPGPVSGIYYIHILASDSVGNEVQTFFGPYYFDHEPPEVTFSKEPQASNKPLEITITAMDELSGIAEISYQWQGEGDPVTTDQSTVVVDTPMEDDSYTLEVTVTDHAGNTGTFTAGPYLIDSTGPEIVFSKQGDSAPAQVHSVDITVNDPFTDDAKVFVQWTENADEPGDDAEGWQLVYEGELPKTVSVSSPPDADGSYFLHVRAIDGLGNTEKASTTQSFVLDNTDPDVEFIPDGNNGVYAREVDVQLKIDGSETGLDRYRMFYVITREAEIDESGADWQPTSDGKISISGRSGQFYIHARVIDEADNSTVVRSEPFATDHLPPTGSVRFVEAYTKDTEVLVELTAEDNIADTLLDVSYSINGAVWSEWLSYTDHLLIDLDPDLEGKQQITVRYRDSARNVSEEFSAETIYDVTPPTMVNVVYDPSPTGWTQGPVEVTLYYEDNLSPDGTVTKQFTENGAYIIEFFDLAGNRNTYEVEITNIDTVKPQIDFTTNGSSVPQKAVSTKIIAVDNKTEAGELLVFYGWSPGTDVEPAKWTLLPADDPEVSLAGADGYWYLWAKATDEAGNEEVAKSGSFLLDNTPPQPVITYDPPTRTANAVIARITFDEEAFVQNTDGGVPEYVFTGNGEFTFRFVDMAGNEGEATAVVSWIDKSLPSAQVIRSPGSWTNGDVEVTLRVDGEPPRRLTNIQGPPGSELLRLITKEYGEITTLPLPEGEITVTEAVYKLTENGMLTFTIIDLETGAINPEEKVIVDYIDRVPPTGELIYSTTKWTNQDVHVTLQASDDRSNVTIIGGPQYTFKQNGSYTFKFHDEAGNYSEITAVVDWIDKEAPNPVVVFDHPTWTRENVTATIFFANETEPVEILNHDGQTSFTFEKNGQVTVHYRDIAGNEGQTTIVVDWIDREAPTGYLVYSTTDWTNEDVTVTLHVDDNSKAPLIFISEGSEGGNVHKFSENGPFTFIVQDQAGNISSFTAEVRRIDKTPPKAEVFYSTTSPTNTAVQATISPDEAVTVLNNNGRTFYNFTDNGQFTFVIMDRAGNVTNVPAEVTWIDRDPPIPQITYSTTEMTNKPVIATVSANEPFLVQNNNRSDQYVFTENGSFTFYIQDLAGNMAEITAVVSNIDSSKPNIDLIYSHEEPTTENVTVEVKSDRALTILNNGGSSIVTFEKNGVFRLEAVDGYGSRYVIPIEVDFIDRTAPQIMMDQGSAQLLIGKGEAVQPLLGVRAYDNLDGDLTGKLVVDHNIDPSVPGEYKITYRVQDRAGNETIAERKALVLEVDSLTIFVNGQIPDAGGLTVRGTEISLQIFAGRGDVKVRWSEGRKYLGDFKLNQDVLEGSTLNIERQNYYTFLIEDQERQFELIHVYVIPTH